MPTNPLSDLVMAAANLKAAAPQFYAPLVSALRAYEVASIVEMTAGDNRKDVFRAQGKVKILQLLRRNLEECTELRDTYQRRDFHGRPNPV